MGRYRNRRGFGWNLLSIALYQEAVDLVMRGVCSVEDVDKAVNFSPGLRYALMGPNLIHQLGGGAHGIKGLLRHVENSMELWWEDMETWKKWPPGREEMANRSADEGRTYRRDCQVEGCRPYCDPEGFEKGLK